MLRFHDRRSKYSFFILVVMFGIPSVAESKKVVFISGGPSHGYGSHEHYAGCMLLAKCLREAVTSVDTVVHKHRWPENPESLNDADTVVLFADGGRRHNPILPHLDQFEELMNRGVGFACLHYALTVPKGQAGESFKRWLGGYYELHWSVNPHWKAKFQDYCNHPVTRGVKPFEIDDEWYYHMRFQPDMGGVKPILTSIPPDPTRQRPDGPHSGNPTVRSRAGMREHMAWAYQRPNGGRGFGFTGGHWHWNWANDSFRTIVLNGIAWTAKIEIPKQGIQTTTPTWAELQQHQDFPQPEKFDRRQWLKRIESWQQQ